MELKQAQKQTQKLALTFQMRQSLHILQLPLTELSTYLNAEIESNPILETLGTTSEEPDASLSEKINMLQDAAERSFVDNFIPEDSLQEIRKKENFQQSLITKSQTLHEVLLRQLRFCLNDEKMHCLGRLLISHIDDNGYLNTSLESLCAIAQKENSDGHLPPALSDIEAALKVIQQFEPHGVGARSLKECLLIQLRLRKKEKTLLHTIVEDFLPEAAKHNIKGIAKKLKVHPDNVAKALKEIAQLEPKPGRAFLPVIEPAAQTQPPDIFVEKKEDRLEIIVNQQGLPRMIINTIYKNIAKSKDADAQTKAYIKEKIKSAMDLIKAILQREETLRTICECIVDIQKDFFLQGDTSLLKPLTLKEVAKIANRDQSTISRVVNNKYVKTPYGIFKLNFFFLKPLKNKKDVSRPPESLASTESIKSLIDDIINDEDKTCPLKDSAIVERLKEHGITIARRTVVKYREEYNIPPAHRRKALAA